MSKDLDRALALLRLATDPATGEAEARTAGLLCCKLIRASGLVLSDSRGAAPHPGGAPRPASQAWASYFQGVINMDDVADMLRDFARATAQPRPPPPPPPRQGPKGIEPGVPFGLVDLEPASELVDVEAE